MKSRPSGPTPASSWAYRARSADSAFAELGARPAVAEQGLDLELELSVMVARRPGGREIVVYPPAVNHHEKQILAWSVLPGDLAPAVAHEAGVFLHLEHRPAPGGRQRGPFGDRIHLDRFGLLVRQLATVELVPRNVLIHAPADLLERFKQFWVQH